MMCFTCPYSRYYLKYWIDNTNSKTNIETVLLRIYILFDILFIDLNEVSIIQLDICCSNNILILLYLEVFDSHEK